MRTGWSTKKLKELGTKAKPAVKAGPFGSSLKKENHVKEGYKVYGQEQVIKGDAYYGDYFIDENKFQSLKSCAVSPGDVLISLVGTMGKVLVVPEDSLPGVINPRLLRLSLDPSQISPQFIKLFFEDFSTTKILKRWSQGGTMDVLNADMVGSLKVTFPLLPEQTAIASRLSTWDSAIGKAELLIVAKEQQRKSLMQSLLTGKLRINGFQKSWSEFHLGELFKERSERANDHLPLVSITREKGIIPRNEDRKDTSSEDKSNYLRICPGDIGYNTMRMWQGVSALSSLEGIVSPAYTICTPKKGVDGEFMAFLFKLPRTINLFYRYSQGLTSDTWNLKYKHFKQIKVTIPEIEEQKAIARILKVCDEEINLLKIELAAFQKQKRGLIQKLLTGEWRVKVAEGVSQ